MSKQPVMFDAASAQRIARATIRNELEVRRSTVRPSKPSTPWNPGVARAKVTTAIPTGTFDAPSSSGRAQIYHKDSTGSWRPSADPVKVFNDNPLDAPIPVGRTIKLGWIGGEWWAVSGACKNEA